MSSHLDPETFETVARLAVHAGAAVRIAHGAAATSLDADGGVAAHLYYAVPPETLAPEAPAAG
jgi:hypothetical protein